MIDDQPTRMTTADAAIKTLISHGVDTVFGLPGVHNDPLFDSLFRFSDQIRLIHSRHEQSAGYMALGAALVSGQPQVFSVVPGPGVLNASAAMLTAFAMNAPVMCLAGQIPQADIDRGHGHLHELKDQPGLARHFTRFTGRIRAPHEAPWVIRDAFKTMRSGRQGPSLVECAIDMWGREGAVSPTQPAEPDRAPIDHEAIRKACALIAAAERPLIVVGGGAMNAGPDIIALAERLGAPVLSHRRGRGVIPTTHPLSCNLPVGHRLWRETDLVVAIGTRLFTEQQWGVGDGLKIVRIDIDPEEPDRFHRAAAAIIGDAAECVAALMEALPERTASEGASLKASLQQHNRWLAERLRELEPQMSYLAAIRAALPADGILVEDVTQIGFAARLAYPVTAPRTYISPGYQDNLGWSYGTALGVKAAKPDAPVVAIVGDGGFMYQIGELATAVQHNLGVIAIVFDNGQFGNVRLLQEANFGGRFIASELHNPDFAQLAATFGMRGYSVAKPQELEKTLREAIKAAKPALIHVRCSKMPSPWDMLLMPPVR